jgi:hypothetical protein
MKRYFSGLDSRIQGSSSAGHQGNGHDEAIGVNVIRRVRVASSPNDEIFDFFFPFHFVSSTKSFVTSFYFIFFFWRSVERENVQR